MLPTVHICYSYFRYTHTVLLSQMKKRPHSTRLYQKVI